jgi:cysteinyl-tRNA synthetase
MTKFSKIKFYNTLSRRKEVFRPIKKGFVGIYTCGPTVYSFAHIGNLRSYIFADILKRVFLYNKYKVKQVMNMTDVDDKTIKGSQRENMSLNELTTKYEKIFLNDLDKLNIIQPNIISRATEHIKNMVELIKILLKNGYAYKSDDGIYFSVSKFKDYGKLAKLGKTKIGKERIKNDEYDKENIQDFALWKFWTEEDGSVFWDTKIGKGRPGWHIECSAMSMKYLGKHFDIHTGGTDLIFPHHTNEIAQSEAATNKKFVNYWIHCGFLTFKGKKVSKSKGGLYTAIELQEKGFNPLSFRYLTFITHYRDSLNFSLESLQSAQDAYNRLKNIISELKNDKRINRKYLNQFNLAVNNDLDTPRALSILWKLIRDKKALGKVHTIKEMDKIFGLDLLEKEKVEISSDLKNLIKERENARKEKNWQKSDQLRDKIKSLGYLIEDTPEGQKIKKI